MVRILTEHLESGFFSEARVLSHNYFPPDDSGIKANIRDSSIYGPSGDGSRRFLHTGNPFGVNFLRLQMFGNYSEIYGEIWFYDAVSPVPGADQIIRFYNNAQEMASVRLTPDNKWAPRFGGGLNLPEAQGSLYATWGVWHCLEFYYKISATGEFTGKIDGFPAFSFTGNTVVAGLTSFNQIDMFCQLTASMDLDGLVINDTTGAEDNTWPGIILVASRDPNADQAAHDQWSATSGGSKFPKVSEYPDDPATYIFSVTDAQKQGFDFPAFSVPANSVPISVITEDTALKVSSGEIYQWQKLGATEIASVAKPLGTDLKVVQNRRTKDPTGATWTLANANASSAIVESNL
jgi:hypothetical protein